MLYVLYMVEIKKKKIMLQLKTLNVLNCPGVKIDR